MAASALAAMLGAAAFWPDSDFASTAPSLSRVQEELDVRAAFKPSDEALSGMAPSLALLEGTAKMQEAPEETPEALTVEYDAVHEGSPRHLVAEYISRTFRIPMREARQITDWAVEIGEAGILIRFSFLPSSARSRASSRRRDRMRAPKA